MIAAWLAWRAPALRREAAETAASPWFARAEAALMANDFRVARDDIRGGLARSPASAIGAALLRRWSILTRSWAATPARPAPLLSVDLTDLSADDMAVFCAPTAIPRLALVLQLPISDIVFPTDVEAPTTQTVTAATDPQIAEPSAGDLATAGYHLLAAGDRRGAAARFRAALDIGGDDPRAVAWSRQWAALARRWSGDAYIYLRDSGAATAAATAAPVLGGGQSGLRIAYALDPLARRPLAILGRASAANSERDSAQASLGLTWRPVPAMSLAAERLIPAGPAARAAWNLRLAGGTASRSDAPMDWSVYGEGGIVGARRRDLYAAALGHIGIMRPIAARLTLGAALGGWASVQRTDRAISRAEVGPTVRLRAATPMPLDLSFDYRVRVAGNAAPGSGPALTLSTAF